MVKIEKFMNKPALGYDNPKENYQDLRNYVECIQTNLDVIKRPFVLKEKKNIKSRLEKEFVNIISNRQLQVGDKYREKNRTKNEYDRRVDLFPRGCGCEPW